MSTATFLFIALSGKDVVQMDITCVITALYHLLENWKWNSKPNHFENTHSNAHGY